MSNEDSKISVDVVVTVGDDVYLATSMPSRQVFGTPAPVLIQNHEVIRLAQAAVDTLHGELFVKPFASGPQRFANAVHRPRA